METETETEMEDELIDEIIDALAQEREDYDYGFDEGYNAVLHGDIDAHAGEYLNNKTPVTNASAYDHGFNEGVRQARWNLQVSN